ncbi:WxL domain-containing protein [Listeria grandensis]|uniref:WxL domain-containing protein n=1 Tax=Listeria grandensis TaxID=1494963 RepID=UPI00164E842E|nr:WxL domain-containing protein [Listeria grandensis]MBC6316636.1 WxL domain-containing protein [Listeria grandensis]
MKNKIWYLSAIVASSLVIGGISATAATAGSMDSITDATFIQDTTVTAPLDPTDPNTPVTPLDPTDPADPHTPGTAGPLSIDYVSNFHFGSNVISPLSKTYYAKLDKVKVASSGNVISVPNFVQVTDKRGTNVGWKLTVKQNGQFKTQGATPKALTNAELSIVAGTAKSLTDAAYAPTTSIATLDPTGAASSDIAVAAADKGMGTWAIAFGEDATAAASAISLKVPMGTAKVANEPYKTTLTWNLEDTPN